MKWRPAVSVMAIAGAILLWGQKDPEELVIRSESRLVLLD